MNMFKCLSVAMVLAMSVVQPAFAKGDDKKEFVIVNEAVGVPVFPHDITDRPYEVVGDVKAGVRKATIFSKEASQEKIYKELWERAEKLDADAVINAKYGDVIPKSEVMAYIAGAEAGLHRRAVTTRPRDGDAQAEKTATTSRRLNIVQSTRTNCE